MSRQTSFAFLPALVLLRRPLNAWIHNYSCIICGMIKRMKRKNIWEHALKFLWNNFVSLNVVFFCVFIDEIYNDNGTTEEKKMFNTRICVLHQDIIGLYRQQKIRRDETRSKRCLKSNSRSFLNSIGICLKCQDHKYDLKQEY